MKVVIVEDEILIAEMLKEMLLELGHEVVGYAMRYSEAIELLESIDEIDLVFCDINLNDNQTGIDLGNLIKSKYQLPFIYITSYSDNQTVRDAAETIPSGYIIKPFSKSEIKVALFMIDAAQKKNKNYVIVKDGHDQIKIQFSEIEYVKSDNNYITIHAGKQKIVVRNSLENFLDSIQSKSLIRVHRSFAVNISKIKSISGMNLNLENTIVPISRKFKEMVQIQFNSIHNKTQ